jgi:hypothetical protein
MGRYLEGAAPSAPFLGNLPASDDVVRDAKTFAAFARRSS